MNETIRQPDNVNERSKNLIRKQIQRELKDRIAQAKDKLRAENRTEEGWGEEVFNNFILHFESNKPRGGSPRYLVFRVISHISDKLSEPMEGDSDNSETYLSKTPLQFYSDVDSAAREARVNIPNVWKLWDEGERDKAYERLVKVYTLLRLKGYNHVDLTR